MIKLYHNMHDDHVIRTISVLACESVATVMGVWLYIVWHGRNNTPNEWRVDDIDLEVLSAVLAIKPEVADDLYALFVQKKMIKDGKIFKPQLYGIKSTQRVYKMREKKKNKNMPVIKKQDKPFTMFP